MDFDHCFYPRSVPGGPIPATWCSAFALPRDGQVWCRSLRVLCEKIFCNRNLKLLTVFPNLVTCERFSTQCLQIVCKKTGLPVVTPVFLRFCPSFFDFVHVQNISELNLLIYALLSSKCHWSHLRTF